MASFYRSTIGKKILMAVTGLIMVGYLLTHVTANLMVFYEPEWLDAYAAFLKSMPFVIWPARAVLLASVLVHIVAAVDVTLRNRAARPVGYRRKSLQAATWASRSMRIGGVILLVFIVLHILHFTTGQLHPSAPDFNVHTVGWNVITAFRNGWVVLAYLVAMAALGLHLFHGLWSSSRTLGASPGSVVPQRRPVAAVIAAFLWLGFSIIPLGIFLGLAE
jgi:succinate dehydrogenase / fumarate reductase cytochrome b subunit